jgi:phosphatidylinositol dimannoside acyltransferase
MAATAAPPARSRPQLLSASYRAGARILRVVPPGLRHAAAAPGGTAWFWLSAAQRRAALDNYAAVLGRERDDPEVKRVARRAFQNYGRMLIDFLLIGTLSREEILARMTTDGREHIDEALHAGRGAIMVLPHMGSWDMSAAYAGSLGYPLLAVAERFPGSLNDEVVGARTRIGVKIVILGRAAVRAITEQLQANGIVALMCDLEQGPGVTVDFFGRRAVVPSGPAAFALKTGAALLPVYQYVSGRGRYHGHIDPPMAYEATETKEALMQRVIHRFEEFIRGHPDQWYAFRPMFSR